MLTGGQPRPGTEYSIVSAQRLSELNADTACELHMIPGNATIGVVMLADDALLDELKFTFDSVVMDRGDTFGHWFNNPPHVVVAWVFEARVEIARNGEGLLIHTRPILSTAERAYRPKAGRVDLVYITGADAASATSVMTRLYPSVYDGSAALV